MRDFVEAARAAESAGMLAATAFAGFQHADIHDAGISAVVVADRDRAAARRACDAILDEAWRQRQDFIYRGRPLEQALAEAARIGEQSDGPVLLLDHGRIPAAAWRAAARHRGTDRVGECRRSLRALAQHRSS